MPTKRCFSESQCLSFFQTLFFAAFSHFFPLSRASGLETGFGMNKNLCLLHEVSRFVQEAVIRVLRLSWEKSFPLCKNTPTYIIQCKRFRFRSLYLLVWFAQLADLDVRPFSAAVTWGSGAVCQILLVREPRRLRGLPVTGR